MVLMLLFPVWHAFPTCCQHACQPTPTTPSAFTWLPDSCTAPVWLHAPTQHFPFYFSTSAVVRYQWTHACFPFVALWAFAPAARSCCAAACISPFHLFFSPRFLSFFPFYPSPSLLLFFLVPCAFSCYYLHTYCGMGGTCMAFGGWDREDGGWICGSGWSMPLYVPLYLCLCSRHHLA